jgi:hypothetical protein
MHADLIVGRVLRSPQCEFFECVESTSTKAVYATQRRGGRREQVEEFTIEDALAAGLVVRNKDGQDGYMGVSKGGPSDKSNWSKYRKTMLRHRCATQLARRVYPDVVLGLFTPDEVSQGHDVADAEFEEAS